MIAFFSEPDTWYRYRVDSKDEHCGAASSKCNDDKLNLTVFGVHFVNIFFVPHIPLMFDGDTLAKSLFVGCLFDFFHAIQTLRTAMHRQIVSCTTPPIISDSYQHSHFLCAPIRTLFAPIRL